MRLDKGEGKNSGIISHDPNVGFLSSVICCIDKLSNSEQYTYIIKEHRIKQSYFNKPLKSKLWYCLHGFNIEFHDCNNKKMVINNRPKELPCEYFKIEDKMTEKLSTILCDTTSKQETIFSNHGGCALSCINGEDSFKKVGKNMHRPDLVLKDNEKKEITIIEGKIEEDLYKGVDQLSDDYISEFTNIIKQLYNGYSIKKGLCITISDINTIEKYKNIEYPILFAIDAYGKFINKL